MRKISTGTGTTSLGGNNTSNVRSPSAPESIAAAATLPASLSMASSLGSNTQHNNPGGGLIAAPLRFSSSGFESFPSSSSHHHFLPTNSYPARKKNFWSRWLNKFPNRSKRIDVISRIFFPLMFGMFNVVYWVTYLWRDDLTDLQ